jgi:hypothetical protein
MGTRSFSGSASPRSRSKEEACLSFPVPLRCSVLRLWRHLLSLSIFALLLLRLCFVLSQFNVTGLFAALTGAALCSCYFLFSSLSLLCLNPMPVYVYVHRILSPVHAFAHQSFGCTSHYLVCHFAPATAMFYAAMYALKGRDARRTAAALQQLSSVDLGGRVAGECLVSCVRFERKCRQRARAPFVLAVAACACIATTSDILFFGLAAHSPAPARTMALASSSAAILGNVPAVSDCGLFGTTCDGNTYTEVSSSLESALCAWCCT